MELHHDVADFTLEPSCSMNLNRTYAVPPTLRLEDAARLYMDHSPYHIFYTVTVLWNVKMSLEEFVQIAKRSGILRRYGLNNKGMALSYTRILKVTFVGIFACRAQPGSPGVEQSGRYKGPWRADIVPSTRPL